MNNERRKRIEKVIASINELQDQLEELQLTVEEVRDEEQEYLDNVPENLQSSERYENAENALCNLEDAVNWFDNLDIDELTSALEEAISN